MSRKQKFFILVASFLSLSWFVFQPINKMGLSQPYMEMPAQEQPLDAAELNEFLGLWARIMQGNLRGTIRQLSLSSKATYPAPLTKWLAAQNWNVNRFFRDEQRLRELVVFVNLRNNLKSNLEAARFANANLSELVAEQKRRMEACPFSEEELSLVENNLYQITEILAGRAVLAK